MSSQPLTKEDVLRIFEGINPAPKTSDMLQVEITPDSIRFIAFVPLDEKTDERIKKLTEKLEPFLDQKRLTRSLPPIRSFASAPKPDNHITTQPPQGQWSKITQSKDNGVKSNVLPYGIDRIKWFPNTFGAGEVTFPFTQQGEARPETQELLAVLKNLGKAVEIQGLSYSLNPAGNCITRKPAGGPAK
jgi:hypothetical protein